MARQRVSDTLKEQDRATAAALFEIATALAARYPASVDLQLAVRGLRDFSHGLLLDLNPRPTSPVPTLREAMGYPPEEPQS